MSSANFRGRALPKLLVPATVLGGFLLIMAAGVFLACGQKAGSNVSSDVDKNFLRDVATAEANGLPVYWLGRGFTAGGVTFDGPYWPGPGSDVDGGEIQVNYIVWLEGTRFEGATTSLFLTVYSRDAWAIVEDIRMNPRSRGVTRETVTIQGRDAELLYLPREDGSLNALSLVLHLGGAVVWADVHADASIGAGRPDPNPFINNPDLLVQVLNDNLRPYPE